MDSSTSSQIASQKFQPGIYKIVNYKSGTVVDLSASDNKTIIVFPEHGGLNQQWDISPLGAGYSIRSMHNGSCITVEAGIHNGVQLVATPFPVSWAFEPDDFEQGIWRMFWPNSSFGFDLSSSGTGSHVQLWERYPYEPWRIWRLVMCETKPSAVNCVDDLASSKTMDTPIATTADTVIDAEGLKLAGNGELTITTQTTTTTTTVTKIMRVNCA